MQSSTRSSKLTPQPSYLEADAAGLREGRCLDTAWQSNRTNGTAWYRSRFHLSQCRGMHAIAEPVWAITGISQSSLELRGLGLTAKHDHVTQDGSKLQASEVLLKALTLLLKTLYTFICTYAPLP